MDEPWPEGLLFCQGKKRNGTPCDRFAGEGTSHFRFGMCSRHGGKKKQVEAAWKMALTISAEHPTISPWDSLLWASAHAHMRALLLEGEYNKQVELNEGGALTEYMFRLLQESRKELQLEATLSNHAINAGLAAKAQHDNAVNGRVVALALVAALDKLELTPEQRTEAISEAHKQLSAIEAQSYDT